VQRFYERAWLFITTPKSCPLGFKIIQTYKIYSSISPSTRSVNLVGSWDNFQRRYPMEKDSRKGAGEWRGLHSFKDITLDGDGARSPKRNGGLKMGHDYWYYVCICVFLLLIFSDIHLLSTSSMTEPKFITQDFLQRPHAHTFQVNQ
jgi:hypothetical protein